MNINIYLRNKHILRGLTAIPKVMGIAVLTGTIEGIILPVSGIDSGENAKATVKYLHVTSSICSLFILGKGCNSLFIAKKFHNKIKLSG